MTTTQWTPRESFPPGPWRDWLALVMAILIGLGFSAVSGKRQGDQVG